MKLYKDLKQQSEDWLELKYGKIGGSSLKDIMTKQSDPITATAKFLEMCSCRDESFEYEECYVSPDMERGNAYEPLARKEFERVYDKQIVEIGWAEMDNGIAGISPDGLVQCHTLECATEGIEIKCPSRKTHSKYIRDPKQLLMDYLWQVVMYFVVFDKMETVYLLSYRPENKRKDMVVVDVKRDTPIKIKEGRNEIQTDISGLALMAELRIKDLCVALIEDEKKFSETF